MMSSPTKEYSYTSVKRICTSERFANQHSPERGELLLTNVRHFLAACRLKETMQKEKTTTGSLVHVRNLHPGANLHPRCIFGHVNGVLRISTRVQICARVQICSNSRGGANLFAPGCKLCT